MDKKLPPPTKPMTFDLGKRYEEHMNDRHPGASNYNRFQILANLGGDGEAVDVPLKVADPLKGCVANSATAVWMSVETQCERMVRKLLNKKAGDTNSMYGQRIRVDWIDEVVMLSKIEPQVALGHYKVMKNQPMVLKSMASCDDDSQNQFISVPDNVTLMFS